jgi:hypothetical protein
MVKLLSQKSGKTSRLGFWAGLALSWLTAGKPAVTQSDVRKLDFLTSSQKFGLRFTERLRDVFRFRWLTRK